VTGGTGLVGKNLQDVAELLAQQEIDIDAGSAERLLEER
jgi:hypothetical protein